MVRLFLKISTISLACLFIIAKVHAQSPTPGPSGYVFPLKLGANNHLIYDQTDKPYFMSGDAGWSLIVQGRGSRGETGNNNDITTYLDNRHQKGFNTILVNLIDHQFGTNAPSDIYGDAPFTGVAFKSTPNDAYFLHSDYVVSEAAKRGTILLLDPLYLGYNCGSEGWCAEVQAASTSDMTTWGQYVGNRYKNYDNIIWVIGGDVNPVSFNIQDKVTAFVTGLEQSDARHLITADNNRGTMAVTPWSGVSWLTLNNIYSDYASTYQWGQTAYNYSPTMPFFQIEGWYENEHGMTRQQLRAQAYWTILSGGIGYVFGNCPLWGLGSPAAGFCNNTSVTWQASLDYPGSVSMSYVQQLFNSKSWQNLVPDFSHTTLTAGYASGTSYVTAARSSDSSLVIAYLPTNGSVTVDMTKLSGSVTARWYDPANGTYTNISGSPFSNTGSRQFTSVGNNSSGDSDWVLVLETTISPTPPTPTPTPAGDINGDGKIDGADLFLLLKKYLTTDSLSDLNKDGIVNFIDGGILINNIGK